MSKDSLFSQISVAPNASSVEEFTSNSNKTFKTFSKNIKDLQKKIESVKSIFTDSDLDSDLDAKEKEMQRKIAEAFKSTVGGSVDELRKYLDEQEEKKGASLLFEERLIELILKVLESIKSFQEKVNSLHPKATDKIIDYVGNAVIAAIAIVNPAIGLAVKGSGVLDSVKSFIKTDNLTKTVDSWKEKLGKVQSKMEEVAQDPELKPKYQVAEQIIKIAQETELSPLSIAELGLDVKALQKMSESIAKYPEEKAAFKKIIELSEQMPNSVTDVRKNIKEIHKGMTEFLADIPDIPDMPEITKKVLENSLKKGWIDVEKNLADSLDANKSPIEKLECCHKAAKTISAMESQIQEKVKSVAEKAKTTAAFKDLISDKVSLMLPKEFLQSNLKSLNEIVKTGRAMQLLLENSAGKKQKVEKGM